MVQIKSDMVTALSHVKWSTADANTKDRWIHDLQKSLFKLIPFSASVDLANTGADAFVENDITVTGILATDMIIHIGHPELTADHALVDAWIDTADVVSVTMENESASGINEGAATWYFLVARRKTTVLS